MTDDKRSHKRFVIQCGAIVKLSSGTIVSGYTRDLSFGGSFIECDPASLQTGDECYLSVVLEQDGEPVEIFSTICYQNEHGVGCHFLTFDAVYYQFLTNYALKTSEL